MGIIKTKLKISILFICLLGISISGMGQKTDKKLEKELKELITGFKGDIGIYVKNLRTGKVVKINSDTIFPTASMVKIPILVGVTDKIAKGELSDTTTLIYKDSLYYAGEDILGSFKENEKIALGKITMLMLTMSDNTASLWLQSLAGGGKRINEILDSLGFEYTRVNSRTEGRHEDWRKYGWGQTTPLEMGVLMELIADRKLINKEQSEQMLRQLGRNFWDHAALSALPPDVFVASKNGAVNASRSEVLYVNNPGNPYIMVVCTKNNQNLSWSRNENEAWILTRKISRLIWESYSK